MTGRAAQWLDLWWLNLAQPALPDRELTAVLNAAERHHISSLRRQRDRHDHRVAHGLLRTLLGKYLRQSPEVIEFKTNPWGKPAIMAATPDTLHFNLSYGTDHILLAVSSHPVGVDVEALDQSMPSAGQVAQRFFTASEAAWLARSDSPQAAFVRCWTAKEAVLKCLGHGLAIPLNSVAVMDAQGCLQSDIQVDLQEAGSHRVLLAAVNGLHGHLGAVAVSSLPSGSLAGLALRTDGELLGFLAA